MLTGDKLETAICIAISTSLKGRLQAFEVLDAREVTSARRSAEKGSSSDMQGEKQRLQLMRKDTRTGGMNGVSENC